MFYVDKQLEFQEAVWEHYRRHGRKLPWREAPFKAYNILVSEVMLQQTQVARVVPKYQMFISRFPTPTALATAPLADVLRAWNGLGYNRRAKYLHQAAKRLANIEEPWHPEDLTACKGIGDNTAAAVLTYAYNQPIGFIETNIRTVYIHHFFVNRTEVADSEILPLVWATLDLKQPREFMWALMDYGAYLKTTLGNLARFSKHHSVQSRFEGSRRQIRGLVLRQLSQGQASARQLQASIQDDRLASVLTDLEAEGLIHKNRATYQLAS